jgi:hypothetical protein
MSAPERPRTGLLALKAKVKLRGLGAIDKRTLAARHLLSWRRDLIEALGGEREINPQQRRLVELATRVSMYIDHADGVLMARNSLVTRRWKLIPLVEQRTRLAEHQVNILGRLGLERQRPPALDIALEIQRQRNGLAHVETATPEGTTVPTGARETESAGASPSAHAAP